MGHADDDPDDEDDKRPTNLGIHLATPNEWRSSCRHWRDHRSRTLALFDRAARHPSSTLGAMKRVKDVRRLGLWRAVPQSQPVAPDREGHSPRAIATVEHVKHTRENIEFRLMIMIMITRDRLEGHASKALLYSCPGRT